MRFSRKASRECSSRNIERGSRIVKLLGVADLHFSLHLMSGAVKHKLGEDAVSAQPDSDLLPHWRRGRLDRTLLVTTRHEVISILRSYPKRV
jgi:hypothetical protein